MTCPCPRPPGLTDDEVRGILDCIGDEVAEYVARRGGPYPIVGDAQTRRVWHVLEWRRCGAVGSGGGRCVWATGHLPQPTYHTAPFPGGRPSGGQAWNGPPVSPPAGEPSWPVPCWVTTADEAERWRPAGVGRPTFVHDHGVSPSCALPCSCGAACVSPMPSEHWPHRCGACRPRPEEFVQVEVAPPARRVPRARFTIDLDRFGSLSFNVEPRDGEDLLAAQRRVRHAAEDAAFAALRDLTPEERARPWMEGAAVPEVAMRVSRALAGHVAGREAIDRGMVWTPPRTPEQAQQRIIPDLQVNIRPQAMDPEEVRESLGRAARQVAEEWFQGRDPGFGARPRQRALTVGPLPVPQPATGRPMSGAAEGLARLDQVEREIRRPWRAGDWAEAEGHRDPLEVIDVTGNLLTVRNRPHDPAHCDLCKRGEPLIRFRVRDVITPAQLLQLRPASRGLTFIIEPTPEEIRADERNRVQAALAIGDGLAEAEELRRRRRELCPKHNPFPSERSSTVWSPSCPGCAPWARWDDPSRPDVDAMARAQRQRWAIGGGL